MQSLAWKKTTRLDIRFMEDIFSTSFDSDYQFLGFSKLELDMDTATVARLIRISKLTESHVLGPDLGLEILTQGMDVTTNIKKDIIEGTNLFRNGYLRAGEALQCHRPPLQTTEKLLGVGLGLWHLLSCIMPSLESVCRVICALCMTKADVIKEDIATIRNKATKLVKGMHPSRSLIWLSEYRG